MFLIWTYVSVFEPLFLGWGDGTIKIGIAKRIGGGKFTENEQMKISSYNLAPSKYNIQDNTKN